MPAGRIVIVGGGVAGLVGALALRRRGFEVAVLEKYDHLQGRATGFTVWSYATKKLLELGVDTDALATVGTALEVTEVHNEHGKLLYALPLGDAGRELGAPTYDIDRADFQRLLIDALGEGTVAMGHPVTGVSQPRQPGTAPATVELADGGRLEADVVVGADGIHAVTRSLVAPHGRLRYSGYAALSAVTDAQGLVDAGHHVEIWAHGAKAGIGDVGGGKVRWYVTAKTNSGGGPWSKERLLAHVEGWPPVITSAIEATAPEAVVLAEGWFLEPLAHWRDRRLVLMGDAAHATTAFGSSGACAAIEDAVEFAACLGDGTGVDEGLATFVSRRKDKADTLERRSERLQHLAQLHNPAAWARDALFEHTPSAQVDKIARQLASGTG